MMRSIVFAAAATLTLAIDEPFTNGVLTRDDIVLPEGVLSLESVNDIVDKLTSDMAQQKEEVAKVLTTNDEDVATDIKETDVPQGELAPEPKQTEEMAIFSKKVRIASIAILKEAMDQHESSPHVDKSAVQQVAPMELETETKSLKDLVLASGRLSLATFTKVKETKIEEAKRKEQAAQDDTSNEVAGAKKIHATPMEVTEVEVDEAKANEIEADHAKMSQVVDHAAELKADQATMAEMVEDVDVPEPVPHQPAPSPPPSETMDFEDEERPASRLLVPLLLLVGALGTIACLVYGAARRKQQPLPLLAPPRLASGSNATAKEVSLKAVPMLSRVPSPLASIPVAERV